MALRIPKPLKPVTDFAIQVVIGAIAFALILLVAVGLAWLVQQIEGWGVAPVWMIEGLHWLEWTLFWVDAVCFVLFLMSEVIKLVMGLWRELIER